MDLDEHTDEVNSIDLSPDQQYFATVSKDQRVILWLRDGTVKTIFEGHTHWVLCCKFTLDSQHVVSGSRDKTLIM